MKKAMLSLAVVLAVASLASATTVTFTVQVNTTVNPKTFSVYASESPDNAGLAIFNFNMATTGDVVFNLGANINRLYASQGSTADPVTGDPVLTGWSQFRNAGTQTATSILDVRAAQNTPYGDVNDPFLDSTVTQGVGLSGSPGYKVFGGQFTGTNGTIVVLADSTLSASVLKGTNGSWTGPGNIAGVPAANIVCVPGVVTPEPATLSLLVLSGVGMLIRRRRA